MSNFIQHNIGPYSWKDPDINEKAGMNGPVNIDAIVSIVKGDDDNWGEAVYVIEFIGAVRAFWYYTNESDRDEQYEQIMSNRT